MTVMNTELITEERLARVDELDLGPVIFKLLHPESGGPRLGADVASRDAELYRCFLRLCVLYPGRALVPTREIDHAWHTHMLDTAKYRMDCERVFGRPLDHYLMPGCAGGRTAARGGLTSPGPGCFSPSTSASRSAPCRQRASARRMSTARTAVSAA